MANKINTPIGAPAERPTAGVPIALPAKRRGVVFLPDRDSKLKDYTGAFNPESERFAEMYSLPRVKVNITRGGAARRAVVLATLEPLKDLEVVAFFTHGLRASLPQMGFDLSNVRELGAALAEVLVPHGVVVLYACSTAGGIGGGVRGEGGFADALRDVISAARPDWTGHIDAHERAAHTTKNALCRRFSHNKGDTKNVGAEWIVAPDEPLFRAWKRNELAGDDGMRFRFPFMSIADIRAEVARDASKVAT
jgi:hypothetical protein